MTTTLRLRCLIEGEDIVFTVTAAGDDNVSILKESIQSKRALGTLKDIDPHALELWKPKDFNSIAAKPRNALVERIGLLGDLSNFADELEAVDSVFSIFPTQPPGDYIHIIVKVSRTELDLDREERKKPRIHTFPLELSLVSLHERLQKINPDFSRYSDPHYVTTFPFPFIGDRLPAERFDFRDFHFDYMGRTAFSELLQKVEKMKIGDGLSQLYIQGTMGYGKSHMLAVLVGLLSRHGKQVVYLPDCRELLRNTMPYLRTALLCAFADPLLSGVRNKIRALESENDVIAFCEQHRSMYIIIDQINALDHEDSNMDTVNNGRKDDVQQFLHHLTSGQFQITSASANHKTAIHMKQKQTNELKLELRGGMSEDEMKQWWTNHEKKLPILGQDDKASIEDLTGRIPLLLRPLLDFAEKPFDEIETEFWTHPDLVAVSTNVFEFSAQKAKKETPFIYEQFYLSSLLSCLTASSVTYPIAEWFDYRYFYMDDKRNGKYTCGLASQAATVVIRRRSPGLLCSQTWTQSLYTFRNNPSVVGFLVEQVCLSTISATGFHHSNIKWQSFTATTFKGDLLEAFGRGSDEKFFIPEDPFKDIDTLYLKVNAEEKMVVVVPIQVTISKTHKDSEAAFYSQWTDWQKHFGGYTLTTSFVWIVEDKHSWMVKEEEFRTTRQKLKLISPQHEQIFVMVQDINTDLGLALKAIR